MSSITCVIDGKPFGKVDREHVCVVCARRVCSDHSTADRMNPHTGEAGRACQRCLGQTIDDKVEAQVAWLHREVVALQQAQAEPVREALKRIEETLGRIEARLPPAAAKRKPAGRAPTPEKRTRRTS
jgi:hypothetical protein